MCGFAFSLLWADAVCSCDFKRRISQGDTSEGPDASEEQREKPLNFSESTSTLVIFLLLSCFKLRHYLHTVLSTGTAGHQLCLQAGPCQSKVCIWKEHLIITLPEPLCSLVPVVTSHVGGSELGWCVLFFAVWLLSPDEILPNEAWHTPPAGSSPASPPSSTCAHISAEICCSRPLIKAGLFDLCSTLEAHRNAPTETVSVLIILLKCLFDFAGGSQQQEPEWPEAMTAGISLLMNLLYNGVSFETWTLHREARSPLTVVTLWKRLKGAECISFLLKDLLSGPRQLHLAHCNQTNHGGWWPMIAFRPALSLSPLPHGHLLQSGSETMEMEARQRPWVAAAVTVKPRLSNLGSLVAAGL